MENRNIYKMDDVLIIASFLMLIPMGFFAWPWLKEFQNYDDFMIFVQSAPKYLGGRLGTVILYGVGAVTAQLVGRGVRYKEKQSLKILDALEYSRKSTVDQLALSTGLSAPRIRTLVRKLSRIPSLNISLEGNNVLIGSRKNPYERSAESYERKPVSPARESGSSSSGTEASVVQPPVYETPRESSPKGEVPSELEAIMKDPQLGVIEKIRKLQEYGKAHPEYSQEDLKRMTQKYSGSMMKSPLTSSSDGKGSKKKFPIILLVILFMSPLWPVALIIVILTIIKQRKSMIPGGESVKKL